MNALLLDIDQVAAALCVGKRTAYALRARPDFPRAVILGPRCVRYRTAEVAAFVDRLAAEAAPRPEPAELAAARANRGKSGGKIGGAKTPAAGKQATAPVLADGSSVELRNSNSAATSAARKPTGTRTERAP